MRFVNISNNPFYSSISNTVLPGGKSPDMYHKFEEVLETVIKTCGDKLGVILSHNEAELLSRLMDLDSRGVSFKKTDIPEAVRKDPYGQKRLSDEIISAHHHAQERDAKANAEKSNREKLINGETSRERRPVGPATLGEEGEEVTPSKLKSGFEAIMEENARIAAGKHEKKVDVGEMLDPIGAHMSNGNNAEDKKPEEHAVGADVSEPSTERGNGMDEQAADVASQLSAFGPADGKRKGRGRQKQSK